MKEKAQEKEHSQKKAVLPEKQQRVKYVRPEIFSVTKNIGVGMPPPFPYHKTKK
jgi:hypothetical protein